MIEKGEQTKITLHNGLQHGIGEGEHILIREVEGMTEINQP
jgi:hypothetical protein